MSSVAEPGLLSQGPLWTLPEIRRAPRAFRVVARILIQNWRYGVLTFVLPSGREIVMRGDETGPEARLIVHNFNFVRRVLTGGDIGFAEGFMAGEWDTPNLAALLEAFTMNLERIRQLHVGNPLMRAVNAVSHFFNRNTRRGSRKNIHAHYDLGNAFYSSWLDPSMTYSSALYAGRDVSLQEAQRQKYANLAEDMALKEGMSVLEIGCGWGGFAEFAAREIGAQVTGITISKAQHDFAKKRLFDQGLADKAKIVLVDYRDVEGRFDRVASIEMFEAVGERYWPAYFNKVAQVLEPGGRAGLQIITIRDEDFEHYRSRPDFIQKYIFPGGMLPSETRLKEETAAAGLTWTGIERFGRDYARTCATWAERFEEKWSEITRLGFDERFRKLWLFYLGYCQAGFNTGHTNVVQLQLAKA